VAQALHWFSQAAEQGDPGAQHNLGMMYEGGKGVPQDQAEAILVPRAAEQGYARSQFALALRYDSGQGVARDVQQALDWLRKAAE
jgi:TPR repeat protein